MLRQNRVQTVAQALEPHLTSTSEQLWSGMGKNFSLPSDEHVTTCGSHCHEKMGGFNLERSVTTSSHASTKKTGEKKSSYSSKCEKMYSNLHMPGTRQKNGRKQSDSTYSSSLLNKYKINRVRSETENNLKNVQMVEGNSHLILENEENEEIVGMLAQIEDICEFVSENVVKHEESQRFRSVYLEEMARCPLEVYLKQLQCKEDQVVRLQNKLSQNQDRIKLIDSESTETQSEILAYDFNIIQLINNYSEVRKRSKTVEQLQSEIRQKQRKCQQIESEAYQALHETKIFINKQNKNITSEILQLHKQMEDFGESRTRIVDLKEKIYIAKKMIGSSRLIFDQLVIQKSAGISKIYSENPQLYSVNLEQNTELHKSIAHKLAIIKTNYETSTQNNKFLCNLRQIEEKSSGLQKLTAQKHKITPELEQIVRSQEPKFLAYRQYLSKTPEISKQAQQVKQQVRKYDRINQKTKNEVQQTKERLNEDNKRVRQLHIMQTTRDAQIKQLMQILQVKSKQLQQARKAEQLSQRGGIDTFTQALLGIPTIRSSGLLAMNKPRKSNM